MELQVDFSVRDKDSGVVNFCLKTTINASGEFGAYAVEKDGIQASGETLVSATADYIKKRFDGTEPPEEETTERRLARVRDEIQRILRENDMSIVYNQKSTFDGDFVIIANDDGCEIPIETITDLETT